MSDVLIFASGFINGAILGAGFAFWWCLIRKTTGPDSKPPEKPTLTPVPPRTPLPDPQEAKAQTRANLLRKVPAFAALSEREQEAVVAKLARDGHQHLGRLNG